MSVVKKPAAAAAKPAAAAKKPDPEDDDDEDDDKPITIKVGDTVYVAAAEKEGIIRFIGTVKFKPGKWVGIELDHPGGKNNGVVKGVRYFTCPENHGLFAKASMVTPPVDKKGATAAAPASKLAAAPAAMAKPAAAAKPAALSGSPKAEAPKKKSLKAETSVPEAAKAAPAAAKPTSAPQAAAAAAMETPTPKKERLAVAPGGSLADKKLKSDLEAAQAKIASLEKQLSAASRGTTATSYETDAHEESTRRLNNELSEANRGKEKAEGEVRDLKKQVIAAEEFKKKSDQYKKELEEMKKQLEAANAEKGILDETVEELSQEVELLNSEMNECRAELEALRSKNVDDIEAAMGALPTDQKAVARMQAENDKLATNMRKLKDAYVTTQQAFDKYKEKAEDELKDLRSRVIKVDELEEELETAKATIDEMRETIEEQGGHEEMIEQLSDDKMDLTEKVKALKGEVAQIQQQFSELEAVEDEHMELENQLTADIEIKEVELGETYRQLQMKTSQIEDLNATNRSYRERVKELGSQLEDIIRANERSGDFSASESERARQQRQHNQRLQQRFSEVRNMTLNQYQASMEAAENSRRFNYLRSYVPDNVDVHEPALQLLLTIDRLKTKATNNARMLDEFYGKSARNSKVAALAYQGCDQCMDFSDSAHKLSYYARLATPEAFEVMVGERDSLKRAEASLDDLTKIISRDEFTEDSSLDDLLSAHEQVVGFIAGNFPDLSDPEASMDGVTGLLRRGPPMIAQEADRLNFKLGSVLSKMQQLGDIIALVPSAEDGNPEFKKVYDTMETLARANQEASKSVMKQASTYAVTVSHKANHNPRFFNQSVANVSSKAVNCQMRLNELVDWLDNLVNGRTLDSTKSLQEIEARFKTEASEGRLVTELGNIKAFLGDLNVKIETGEPEVDGAGFKTPAWELHAAEIRQELTQAASLRVALEEATKKIDDRSRELSLAKRMARDSAAKVDVLHAKLELAQTKAADTTEVKARVELSEKMEQEMRETNEALKEQLVTEKATINQLRKKIVKHMYEIKSLQKKDSGPVSAGSGIVTMSGKHLNSIQVAADEIQLLQKTIQQLRSQMAEIKTRNIEHEFRSSLPLLPLCKPLHVSATSDDVALTSQLRDQGNPLSLEEAKEQVEAVHVLKSGILSLGQRLNALRAAPALVDLSKKDVPAGQEFLVQKARGAGLREETLALQKKMDALMSASQAQAFRSFASTVPAVLGENSGAAAGAPIGKLTIPSTGAASKVVLQPAEFMRLHAVFAH